MKNEKLPHRLEFPINRVRFLRLPEVLDRVGVTAMTIRRWQEVDLFPKGRKIGPRLIGWIERDIDEWCDSRPELSPHRETSDV
jgi:prophage regulatory protein